VSSVPEPTDAQQRVLERLYEGKYATAITDEPGLTRQAVNEHVRNFEDNGLTTEHPGETAFHRRSLGPGASVEIYGLTDAGMAALRKAQALGEGETPRTPSEGVPSGPPGQGDEVNEPAVHDAPPHREPRVEVHNFEVKVPVEGEQQKLWPPGEAELNNRTRRWDSNVHGVFLEATPQHLLLRAGAEAPSVELAEALVLGKLVRAIELLEDAYELELGTPAFRCTCEPSEDTGDVPTEALDLALVGHLLVDELGVVDDLAAVEVVDRHLAEQVGVLEEGAGLDEVVDVAALAAAVEGANLGRDELVDRERLDLDSVALGELEGPGDGLGDREALDGRAFDLDPLVGLRGQGLVAADDAEHPVGVLVVGVDVRVLVVEDVDESAPHPGVRLARGRGCPAR